MKRYLTYGHSFCAVEHAYNTSFQVLEVTKKQKELVISKQENYSSQKAVFENEAGQTPQPFKTMGHLNEIVSL